MFELPDCPIVSLRTSIHGNSKAFCPEFNFMDWASCFGTSIYSLRPNGRWQKKSRQYEDRRLQKSLPDEDGLAGASPIDGASGHSCQELRSHREFPLARSCLRGLAASTGIGVGFV
jgi:hypothetical protein